MNAGLQALRAVDFNWTHDLQSVWLDSAFQVDEIHRSLVDHVVHELFARTKKITDNPIGKVILGEAGAGKTHLIGTLRRRVWQSKGWFVLLDIIGITDFWATAALGVLNSLQQPLPDGRTQYQAVLSAVLRTVPVDSAARDAIEEWEKKSERTKVDTIDLFLKLLRTIDFANTLKHQDVVRALLLLGSDDLEASNLASCWLQGLDVDEARRKGLRFLRAPPPYPELVRGMLWLMSLAGPTLIAVDQIDAIVSASNLLAGVDEAPSDDTERKARAIIDVLAGGLMDFHDLKRRAMTVVSCLQVTWPIIKRRAVQSAADRFEELPVLEPIKSADIVQSLISARLGPAYKEAGFTPPYQTYPFRPEAINSARGLLPRQILKRLQEHRQRCFLAAKVLECTSLAEIEDVGSGTTPTPTLEQEYRQQLAGVDTSGLLEPDSETVACALLLKSCELLLRHLGLPDSIDAIVQPDPDRKKPSLHARVSFTFHAEGDREQHYCFRVLPHTNAIAFQSRLKAAMTASGIDMALKFRHLFILRRGGPPSGPKTAALVNQFLKAGGKFISPTDDDLRAFAALVALDKRNPPAFDAWLRQRRPLFQTRLFQEAGLCPPPFLSSPPPTEPEKKQATAHEIDAPSQSLRPSIASRDREVFSQRTASAEIQSPIRQLPAQPQGSAIERSVPIGRRYTNGTLGDSVMLKTNLLFSHVAILAGSGSGKTVLLRRIVEEAALLGIPAIVLDPNNDLSCLGDAWPSEPDTWSDEDIAKADAYQKRADVVIWTPGAASGTPISLNLLPDFAAIGDKQDEESADERAQAVEMARATLEPYIGGTGQKALLKQGILADALRAFAKTGGGVLDDFVGFLAELPENVSKIGGAPKLGSELANHLLAAIATNPLLQSEGQSLDSKILFEGPSGKTRISVVNLAGLASEEARDSFVNRLQMSLFTFIKRNPSPTGRLYVIDEAQNFAPSGAGTACKASALSLVAQARKYGLGMVFATQTPKGIDNKIVSNCSTHVYGRMNAPATIDAIRELMAAKGGAADDIGKLARGEFYFSTDGTPRPFKVHTPLCLSWHPANPPTAEEVIQKARRNRNEARRG
jgi:Helicase HerA, central domain